MQVTLVPSGHIHNVLPQIMPHLQRLAPRTNGRATVDDILLATLNGTNTLWLAFEPEEGNKVYGVVITTFSTYPRVKTINVLYCAGNKMSAWLSQMAELVKRYAIDNQCSKMECTGRRGWVRVMEAWGAKEAYVVAEIDLGDGNG